MSSEHVKGLAALFRSRLGFQGNFFRLSWLGSPGTPKAAQWCCPTVGISLETRKSKSQRGDATDSEQSPTRILVVEDDFLIAMQTETALSDAGFEVVGTAATAEEAISLAREKHPALAVMDIRLAGERDGIDAARQLFIRHPLYFCDRSRRRRDTCARGAVCSARLAPETLYREFACRFGG